MQDKKALLTHIQKAERQELKDRQRVKRHIITRNGRDKFRRGIMGLFDKVTGKEKHLRLINQKEVRRAKNQQSETRQKITFRHNMERFQLQKQIVQVRQQQQEERKHLALRIHQMRTINRSEKREGLTRDFNNAILDRHDCSRNQTRKHARESEVSSRTRQRRFER